jgi:hypothetical protein
MAVVGFGTIALGVFALVTGGALEPLLFVWIALGMGFLWIGVTFGKHPNRSVWALVLGIFEVVQWTYQLATASEGFRTWAFLSLWIGFLVFALVAVRFVRNLPPVHRPNTGGE